MSTEAKFWDNVADKYAAQPLKDPTAFERKQAITREHLRPDSKVLEIGCGTGSLALALSAFAGHIEGLDVSAEMVRIARGKQKTQSVGNITFRQGTLDGPAPFAPETFDSVLAFSILHLVRDRPQVLRSIFEMLKPGGAFISSNACLGESWLPLTPLLSVARWIGKAPFVSCYDRATITRELHDVGFSAVQEHDVGAEKIVAFIVARKPG